MALAPFQIVAGILAGVSLFLNLFSAGNFFYSSETWMIQQLFLNVHALCNFLARACLFIVVLLKAVQNYSPSTISRYLGVTRSAYLALVFKLLILSLAASFIRMILPGPVTSYSFVYKLGILLNTSALIVMGIDVEGRMLLSRNVSNANTDENANESGQSIQRSLSTDSTNIPTKRHRTAMELLQTETSYLRNLKTIITVYKEPLEQRVASGNPLLAAEDIRRIFGGVKEIAGLHSQLHQDVSSLIDDWDEECCVGDVIKKYKDQLIEVYPQYVNYFDMGQSLLLKKQEEIPELKEFFIDCFNLPQSLKQNLAALLIRPVQRLPSLLLLTSDLQKRTPEELKDYQELEEAKEVLKQVLSHINEDKRKTEAKTKVFDIVYEVTGCPVEVISSNRYFVKKVDVTTLTDGFYRERERLALYLLNDMLEIAKWRNRTHGNSLLKHIELLPLSNILMIMDVQDVDDQCIFAVRYRSFGNLQSGTDANDRNDEKVCILQLLDDRTFKAGWLQSFAAQVAEVKNSPDKNEFLQTVGPSDLLNFVRRNTKLHKKLKSKCKSD